MANFVWENTEFQQKLKKNTICLVIYEKNIIFAPNNNKTIGR